MPLQHRQIDRQRERERERERERSMEEQHTITSCGLPGCATWSTRSPPPSWHKNPVKSICEAQTIDSAVWRQKGWRSIISVTHINLQWLMLEIWLIVNWCQNFESTFPIGLRAIDVHVRAGAARIVVAKSKPKFVKDPSVQLGLFQRLSVITSGFPGCHKHFSELNFHS